MRINLQNVSRTTKLRIGVPLLVIVATAAFAWLSVRGQIRIVSGEADSATSSQVSLLSEKSHDKPYEFSFSGKTATKRVEPGRYLASVYSDDGSYLQAVNVHRFSRTTTVRADLRPQAHASEAGKNPGPCMMYFGERFYSGECQADASYFSRNYYENPFGVGSNTQTGNKLSGGLLSTVAVGNSQFIVLTRNTDQDKIYQLSSVTSNLSVKDVRHIGIQKPNTSYALHPYGSGFIVANTTGTDIQYLQDFRAVPVTITIPEAENKDLSVRRLSVARDSVTLVYTRLQGDEGPIDPKARKQSDADAPDKTEVIVEKSGRQNHYFFDKAYAHGTQCGSRLCMLLPEGIVDVYDVSSVSKPLIIYKMFGVKELVNILGGLRTVHETGVLNFDYDKGEGYMEYVFPPKQEYSTMQQTAQGYLVVTATETGEATVMHINTVNK